MKRFLLETVPLAVLGLLLSPLIAAAATVGFVLSLPTLVRRLPWSDVRTRPHRVAVAAGLLTLKFVVEGITTLGWTRVLLGSSLSSDTHPRGWQLPWGLRVRWRVLVLLRRYLGMERFRGWEAGLHAETLAWCRANAPTAEQVNLAVPRVRADEITPEEFYRRYVASPHPVVLSGLNADTDAVKRWNVDWFRTYADDRAPVTATGSEAAEVMQSSFGDYLDYIEANKHLPIEARSSPKYLANFANLTNRHPELAEQLGAKELAKYLSGARTSSYVGTHFFLGLEGTTTPFHCAAPMNWFCQVLGRKRWTFVHPDHLPLMYPVATGEVFFGGSQLEYPEPPADVMAKDFPLWQYCPRHEIVLEPGDVLLSPSWWWHRIRNEDSPTIGCATRWLLLPHMRTNMLFDLFLTWNAAFFANALSMLAKTGDEPRLTDENTLTLEQRRSRYKLYERLRALRPSRAGATTEERAAK